MQTSGAAASAVGAAQTALIPHASLEPHTGIANGAASGAAGPRRTTELEYPLPYTLQPLAMAGVYFRRLTGSTAASAVGAAVRLEHSACSPFFGAALERRAALRGQAHRRGIVPWDAAHLGQCLVYR